MRYFISESKVELIETIISKLMSDNNLTLMEKRGIALLLSDAVKTIKRHPVVEIYSVNESKRKH